MVVGDSVARSGKCISGWAGEGNIRLPPTERGSDSRASTLVSRQPKDGAKQKQKQKQGGGMGVPRVIL